MTAIADHRAIGPSGYLPTLDGWRAIAILGVMICHASDGLFQTGGIYPNSHLRAIAGHGAMGVDISGIPRVRRMVVIMAGMVSVWRAWEFRHQWLAQLIPAFSNYRWDWRTDIRLDGLLWGCWMALLLENTLWRERLTRWLSPPVW